MKISHNGSEWHGTFGLTAEAMLDDLLSDGSPIKMALRVEDQHGTVTGMVRTVVEVANEHGGRALLCSDGSPVDLDTVLSMEVL